MPLSLFSVFTSVWTGDTLLPGGCLFSTMVTTSFQSSRSCGLCNLRHLKMPLKKITPNKPERVCLNMKVGKFLTVSLNEMPRIRRENSSEPIQRFLPLLQGTQWLLSLCLTSHFLSLVSAPYLHFSIGVEAHD